MTVPMTMILVLLAAFVLAVIFTPLVRKVALAYGYVVQPTQDRWHQSPTPVFGGVGIFFACVLPLLFVLPSDDSMPWAILGGASAVFVLGLLDDFLHIKPYSKLIGQIMATSFIVFYHVAFEIPSLPLVGLVLTFLWIVGITNAFNLLDNMDGLSAGIAAIVALCLSVSGMMTGNELMMILAASVCGASLGFLIFNFYPAKIFMGDSGSLFLGFSLAALAITGKGEYTTNIFFAMLIPVLVLAVPIFDTIFVSLLRFFNGRAISQGGRDHSSHRLVAFGLSERTTVLLFYVLSLFCGMVALLGLQFSMIYPSILAILIVIVLCYFGVFLSGIVTYGHKAENLAKSSGFTLSLFLMHKRRLGEIIVDCILISSAFTGAFFIRFDGLPAEYFPAIGQALPLLLTVKLAIFFYFGLYRGLWRYVGMQDLLNIVKAVTSGSLISVVLMVMVFRFEGYPRSVFVIDWMLLLLAVSGVRLLVKFLDEYLSTLTEQKGKRLLIVGAGDAGEIALRELKANPQLGYIPVGFIDDDSRKWGRSIHGVKILGSRARLAVIVKQYNVQEILIAISVVDHTVLEEVVGDCRATGVVVQIRPTAMPWLETAMAR